MLSNFQFLCVHLTKNIIGHLLTTTLYSYTMLHISLYHSKTKVSYCKENWKTYYESTDTAQAYETIAPASN